MKKIFSVLLCGVLALSLSACDKTDNPDMIPEQSSGTGVEVPVTKMPERPVASPAVFITSTAIPSDLKIYSEGVYMVNLDTDTVVMSKNPDKKLYPASTAKIMTCLVALENVKNFSEKVECPYDCFDEFSGDDPNFYDAATAGIDPLQDNLTYKDCLYGLMLASGCDAGNVIAYNVGGGDIKKFVGMMNETAKKLGCTNTNFTNPHGLFEEDNVGSARDMYLITRYAIDKYPEFMKICDTDEYEMPANDTYPDGYTIHQSNGMLRSDSEFYYKGAKGVKTGGIYAYYLPEDGEWNWNNEIEGFSSLVTTAERNGTSYLLVTLQSPYRNEDGEYGTHYADHTALYDKVFAGYEYTKLIKEGQALTEVAVAGGTGNVELLAVEEYSELLPAEVELSSIEQKLTLPEQLVAPVAKGDICGYLELRYNGSTFAVIDLAAAADVAKE